MGFRWSSSWYSSAVLIVLVVLVMVREGSARIIKSREVESRAVGQSHHDYADALTKSILFFEGQRSGYLPSTQRMTWRKHSALRDGQSAGVDLSGGYYDAGDNVKFNFPMAFTTTMLAWSVLEFGDFMGSDLQHAKYAIKWGTDYFLKATRIPNMVYVQVGQPYSDHDCWERPEDMDTDRTAYVVNQTHPGSEVSAEMAAALAASSMVFRHSMPNYSKFLLNRAIEVFEFADKYQGSYNTSLGIMICPFYCDWNGYKDELVWGAAWLYKATHDSKYWNYVQQNIVELEWYNFGEFGWDDKHAGFNVLIVTDGSFSDGAKKYGIDANKFVCDVLPDSPFKQVKYTPGGLLFKQDGSNLQNPTALSFLLLVYARYLENTKQVVQCGSMTATPENMIALVKSQVDYILGDNPMNMSYMVGYGNKFPNRIHHRGSTLPSKDQHPKRMACQEGKPYFDSPNPNPNLLTGAIVGGPFFNDSYPDSRLAFQQSEPTTYINAPFVGVLAYFAHPH